MRPKALLFTALSCALLWTISAAAAQGQKELKTGKEGEITLAQPTRVGDITLQPGTYVVQHRVSDKQHFVRFMQLEKLRELNLTPAATGWYTYTKENNAGEIKCRVEPAGTTAPETAVTMTMENGTPRITQVLIKGENDVHIF